MITKTLHLRQTPEGMWEWRDDSRDWPVWYPLAKNTEDCVDYFTEAGVRFSDDWVTIHGYCDTQNEPVWNGEDPEKWPNL